MTPSSPAARARRLLQKLGLARPRDLAGVGVTGTQLRRLVDRGEVERVGRGLYALSGVRRDERGDLAEVARRVPEGVVCLLSALRFHGLTTQNPLEVWLAIERKAWRPRIDHPPLRIVYMSGPAFSEGVEEHAVEGVPVRVCSASKTVADCFKFRNKIGIDVAVEALRDYKRQHPKALEAVWRYGRVDRVSEVLRPYLESLR